MWNFQQKVEITDDFGIALVRIHQIEGMFVFADQIGESVKRQHFGAIWQRRKKKRDAINKMKYEEEFEL